MKVALYSAPDDVLLATETAMRWKYYRDRLYNLYSITNDIDSYTASIAWYQQIVKAYVKKHEVSVITATIELSVKETEGSAKLRFLAAAYDLLLGIEYQIQNPIVLHRKKVKVEQIKPDHEKS